MNKESSKKRSFPLQDVTVLDLTRATAGPLAAQMLGDLGATVIKIEIPPQKQKQMRGISSRESLFSRYSVGDFDIHFLSLNRNKKSLTLDLSSNRGKDVFYDLVKVSDVVFDNFRPGSMKRLGLDYETLQKINPEIICCSLTGYGTSGPLRDLPAFDVIIQATSGMLKATTPIDPDGTVNWQAIAVADHLGGIWAVLAILTALYQREQTGEGQHLDIAMQDAAVHFLSYKGTCSINFEDFDDVSKKLLWGVFRAKDDYIVIAAHREPFWQEFCRILGHKEWTQDPLFNTQIKRQQNREKLVALFNQTLSEKTVEEWLKIFGNKVPSAKLSSVKEALIGPQAQARNMVAEIELAGGRKVKLLGNPIKGSGMEAVPFNPPPSIGQNSNEILEEILLYSKQKTAALKKEGII
jgi:crotonobetainyl-CoA:carnitine CoA-transferase CaiB-like acyl-CoA transferase